MHGVKEAKGHLFPLYPLITHFPMIERNTDNSPIVGQGPIVKKGDHNWVDDFWTSRVVSLQAIPDVMQGIEKYKKFKQGDIFFNCTRDNS